MSTKAKKPTGVPVPELVIITGMSGAGRSTAANVLEDLGWFVVDKLPPALLPTLADLGGRTQGNVQRIAAVVDVRSGSFFADLTAAITELADQGNSPRIIFLEAEDTTLVGRFEGVRRPHPLQGDGRLVDGIAREREMLRDLRANADIVIDTSSLNVHELGAKVLQAFEQDSAGLRATVISFGYKHGLPRDADLVLDCRFLPNPHWVPELRPFTGLDAPVRDYVLEQPTAKEFLAKLEDLFELLLPAYVDEGKAYLTVAVGCTGGRHRSVALAEALADAVREHGFDPVVTHRDITK